MISASVQLGAKWLNFREIKSGILSDRKVMPLLIHIVLQCIDRTIPTKEEAQYKQDDE